MSASSSAFERMYAQRVVAPRHERPEEVVRALVAVQAQDYRGGLWGIGLRTRRAAEADIERAIVERRIVRTWPMRGTLHFVAAEDVAWMLPLLTPRVLSRAARRHRALGLDEAIFTRSREALEEALSGGRSLSRPRAYATLEAAGVATGAQRGIHILAVLAMRGVVCFGPRDGRQPTVVLLDEWVPKARRLEGDEALAELAGRYFRGHGPATAADFTWWSGLAAGKARRAVELARPGLERRVVHGVESLAASFRPVRKRSSAAHLLPAWDELIVAYRDRGAFFEQADAAALGNGIFSPVAVVDGRVIGRWRRTIAGPRVRIHVELLRRASPEAKGALEGAAARYAAFVGGEAAVRCTLLRRSSRHQTSGPHALGAAEK